MDGDQATDIRLAITSYNHFAALFSLIIVIIPILFFLTLFNFDPAPITIFAIFFGLDALPALYLHWEYWTANRGMEFVLESNKIIRKKKDGEDIFHTDDMDRIVIYKSASIDKGGIPILAIESYHYARIYLNSGEELIITCLLTPDVAQAIRRLKGVPIERKKRAFNSLTWH